MAEILFRYSEQDLAILKARGLEGTPFKLAQEPADIGRKVFLVVGEDTQLEGIVHSLLPSNRDDEYPRVQHTALIQEGQHGAPLLNNCSEFLGISLSQRRSIFDSSLTTTTDFGTASDLTTIRDALDQNNISYEVSTQDCLSEQEQLTKLQQEQLESDAQITELAQENETRAKELDELEAEREKIETELESLREQLNAAEEVLTESEEESIQKNEELTRASQEIEEKNQALEQVEGEIGALEEEVATTKNRTIYIIAGAAAALVTLGLVFGLVMRKRRKRVEETEQKLQSTQHQVSVERSKAEIANEELEKATATYNDIVLVLDKTTDDSNDDTIKISGDALARSPQGVILGREAVSCDYVIPDDERTVSRQHIRLGLSGDQVTIEDLGTLNGTSVNAEQIEPNISCNLSDGDKLKIGERTGKIFIIKESD